MLVTGWVTAFGQKIWGINLGKSLENILGAKRGKKFGEKWGVRNGE